MNGMTSFRTHAGWSVGLWFIAAVLPASAIADEDLPNLVLCTLCHGTNGLAVSDQWPHLAGQNSRYLAGQSIQYRDGRRQDQNGLMAPWVEDLSDEEIMELAEYYSHQAPAPASEVLAGDVEKGEKVAMQCVACHGTDGTSVNDEWPHLTGQNAAYLRQSMHEYQQGTRPDRSGIMVSFAQGLSAEDIANVSAYYASQQAGVP